MGGRHVGGNLCARDAENMATWIRAFCIQHGLHAVISSSKRTDEAFWCALKANIPSDAATFYHYKTAEKPNPFHEITHQAQALMVTGDSVRMISEACSGELPTYIYNSDSIGFQYKSLHTQCIDAGAAQDASSTQLYTHKPLSEAQKIAETLKVLMQKM